MRFRGTRTGRASVVALVLGLLLTATSFPGAVHPARAAQTFVVTTTGDEPDLNLADAVCDVGAAAGNQCTLRAAIEEADDTPGADTINFNIPGPGGKSIRPTSELPAIAEQITINGYTRPGATPNTLATGGLNAALRIELDGTNAGPSADGLKLAASNSVVRGLTINRFTVNVVVTAGAGSRIEGCFIGTNPAGTTARAGVSVGVSISTGKNVVGGATPAARNLISGNTFSGVNVYGSSNRVVGNLIGTAKDGVSPLGNAIYGVYVGDGVGSVIGGGSTAEANVIAFNAYGGVNLANATTGNRVMRNAIFANGANGGLGIDLRYPFDGKTPNDPGDADTGPNNLQNYPVLTGVTTAGGQTTIVGTLNSRPNRTYAVRFFANPAGGNEGKAQIKVTTVTTDGAGNASFRVPSDRAVAAGRTVTATATDSVTKDTSEFSLPAQVT